MEVPALVAGICVPAGTRWWLSVQVPAPDGSLAGAGPRLGGARRSAPRPEVWFATRSLVSDGQKLGSVTVYSAAHGQAGWLFMSLEVGSWSGKATCEIHLADEERVLLGTFWLDNGYGAWGVSLTPGNGQIASASVVGHRVFWQVPSSHAPRSLRRPRSSGYSGASGT